MLLLPMMLASAVSLLSLPPIAGDGVSVLDGACTYPAKLGPTGPGEIRIPCDSAIISPSGQDGVLVQFAVKGGSGPVGFAGPIGDDGAMSVRRIYLTPGKPTPATGGHCRIFDKGDAVTGIVCVGRIGAQAHIANFRAFAE